MTNKNDGGSAFPRDAEYLTGDKGMTLRQWYAGTATDKDVEVYLSPDERTGRVEARFMHADEMIKEGEK